MKITESQGTKCYLVDESEPLSTSADGFIIVSSDDYILVGTEDVVD